MLEQLKQMSLHACRIRDALSIPVGDGMNVSDGVHVRVDQQACHRMKGTKCKQRHGGRGGGGGKRPERERPERPERERGREGNLTLFPVLTHGIVFR